MNSQKEKLKSLYKKKKQSVKEILEKKYPIEKQIKLYEKLGATKFQKIVFKVEDIKYKIVKRIIPNYLKYFEKWCDKKRDKQIKKTSNEEEKKKIINQYRNQKLLMRKEYYREQNRNYHIDKNKPTEFIKYLKWNKKIHQNGMIKNIITIPILTSLIMIGVTPIIPVLGLELLSLFINFECINIQNYNICRFKKNKEKLEKIEQKQFQKNNQHYQEGAKVIEKAMQQTKDIPSIDEIIANIKDKEQLQQLRKMIKKEKETYTQKKKEKRRK